MTKNFPRHLMVCEAAEKYHVSRKTIYKWLHRELLVAEHVGGILLIDTVESEPRLMRRARTYRGGVAAGPAGDGLTLPPRHFGNGAAPQ
jgi:hypothetical protein